MIAHLGMYDRPETASANDRFWSLIRENLGTGPDALARDMDFWDVWRSPDLLLSQTCGMPFRERLHPDVTLVGTPDYGLPGCPAGCYNSVFVTHKSNKNKLLTEFSNTTFAYNEPLSQSGWAAPMTHMVGLGVRRCGLLQSGGHAKSAQAVAEGRADFAALDALSWQLIQRFDSFADDLIEIERTAPTPTLPYITAKTRDPAPLFQAVSDAIAELSAPDRDLLSLRGLIRIPPETYLAVPTPPEPWD